MTIAAACLFLFLGLVFVSRTIRLWLFKLLAAIALSAGLLYAVGSTISAPLAIAIAVLLFIALTRPFWRGVLWGMSAIAGRREAEDRRRTQLRRTRREVIRTVHRDDGPRREAAGERRPSSASSSSWVS